MTVEHLTKRTIYVSQCECGERDVKDDHPPRERQCVCKRWVPYVEESYVGPDISNAPDAGRVRGGDHVARERASGVKSRI
jgi:hypothetical protein